MRAGIRGAGLVLALAAVGCAGEAATREPANQQDARVIVCAAGSFMSGNECIPVEHDCPSGTVPEDGRCVAAPVAEDPPPDPPDPPPEVASAPTLETFLDGRRGRLQPRSRQLLVTELQALERLFAAAPKDAADRPRLVRRLAETYVELSAAAARDGRATAVGSEMEKAQKIEKAARLTAIKYYQLLVQQHPKFCVSAGAGAGGAQATGCADEALYYLALEYMRATVKDNARKSLLQLLQNYPQSSFTGHAYYLFGEMFFQEAESDPSKWALAEQSYLEAAKHSASPAAPYALLRLAEVYTKKGDGQRAQATLKKLAAQYPGSDAAKQLSAAP